MIDPAGIFPSNAHRRVMAHLSHPDDDYGWSPEQLVRRMGPDPDTLFETPAQVEKYLLELRRAGDAEQTKKGWQMTRRGFDRLNGPIATEPQPFPAPEVVAKEPRFWMRDRRRRKKT